MSISTCVKTFWMRLGIESICFLQWLSMLSSRHHVLVTAEICFCFVVHLSPEGGSFILTKEDQLFSIGDRSRELHGQLRTVICLTCKNVFTFLGVWHGAWSCWNMAVASGKVLFISGINMRERISIYWSDFIIPSTGCKRLLHNRKNNPKTFSFLDSWRIAACVLVSLVLQSIVRHVGNADLEQKNDFRRWRSLYASPLLSSVCTSWSNCSVSSSLFPL